MIEVWKVITGKLPAVWKKRCLEWNWKQQQIDRLKVLGFAWSRFILVRGKEREISTKVEFFIPSWDFHICGSTKQAFHNVDTFLTVGQIQALPVQTSYLSFFLHTDFLRTDFPPHIFQTKMAQTSIKLQHRKLKFVHMGNFFSTNIICDIWDKYELCPVYKEW